jgi:hypothetical protein
VPHLPTPTLGTDELLAYGIGAIPDSGRLPDSFAMLQEQQHGQYYGEQTGSMMESSVYNQNPLNEKSIENLYQYANNENVREASNDALNELMEFQNQMITIKSDDGERK